MVYTPGGVKRASDRYMYVIVLLFYISLSTLIYVAAGGISQAVGLPEYLDIVFRGGILLSFLVFGLVLLYPLISSNSSSINSSDTTSSIYKPKVESQKQKSKLKPKLHGKSESVSSDRYGQLENDRK